MNKITRYACGRCGQEFDDRKECERHENECDLRDYIVVELQYADGRWKATADAFRWHFDGQIVYQDVLRPHVFHGRFGAAYGREAAIETVRQHAMLRLDKMYQDLKNATPSSMLWKDPEDDDFDEDDDWNSLN